MNKHYNTLYARELPSHINMTKSHKPNWFKKKIIGDYTAQFDLYKVQIYVTKQYDV